MEKPWSIRISRNEIIHFEKCMANTEILEHAPPYWGTCQSSTAVFSPNLSQAAKVNHEAEWTPIQPEQRINQIEPQINH